MIRPGEEIDDVLNKCMDYSGRGDSKFPSMSYEDGIRAGIEWVLGRVDENPLED